MLQLVKIIQLAMVIHLLQLLKIIYTSFWKFFFFSKMLLNLWYKSKVIKGRNQILLSVYCMPSTIQDSL